MFIRLPNADSLSSGQTSVFAQGKAELHGQAVDQAAVTYVCVAKPQAVFCVLTPES
jgi:hypothetical protein